MKKYRTPAEISKSPRGRVPVSFRIEDHIRDELVKMADKEKLSLSELIENVVFDYYCFLKRAK